MLTNRLCAAAAGWALLCVASFHAVSCRAQEGFVFTVDRDSGSVSLRAPSTSDQEVRGYSLFSAFGSLNGSEWISIAGSGGDPDDVWFEFSRAPTDISEATVGFITLSSGESLALDSQNAAGNLWRRGPFETGDLVGEVALADGSTVNAGVSFTGNSGNPFKLGDLDLDGDVDAGDYAAWNANYLTDLNAGSAIDLYALGDLDLDGDNDRNDFVLFKNAFLADGNTPAAFAAAVAGANVPEPTGLVLVGVVVAFAGASRVGRKTCRAVASIAAIGVALCGAGSASAQPILIYDAADGIGIDSSGSGNNGSATGPGVSVVSVGPMPGDSSYSFDGSGDRIITDQIDLLENSLIVDAGGFAMDVWFRAQAAEGSSSIVDYAGTENINLRSDGSLFFRMHNSGSAAVEYDSSVTGLLDGDWHRVTAGFTVVNGSNPGAIIGDVQLIVDGTVQVFENQELGAFGDDLNRTIGIGGHPLGFPSDVFTGQIHMPTVALGTDLLGSPASLGLEVEPDGDVYLVHNASNLFENDIAIDLYEISSASGAIRPNGWFSLEDQSYLGGDGPGQGVGWRESGGQSDERMGETLLVGSTLFDEDSSRVYLGQIHDPAAELDLELTYRDATRDAFRTIAAIAVPETQLPGDFNGDGSVDAADYTVWRDNLGAEDEALINNSGDGNGVVDDNDYVLWTRSFGRTGAALGRVSVATPEPTTAVLIAIGYLASAAAIRNAGREI